MNSPTATQGRSVPLTSPRRLVIDLLHFSKKVPSIPVQRTFSVRELVQERNLELVDGHRISWVALFIKAFGLIARDVADLRRAYLGFPWPRLYEHPCSIACVAVTKRWRGQEGVFFGHIREPEHQSLTAISERVRAFRNRPVEEFGVMRRALRTSRLPRPLRRLLWWYGLNVSGWLRASHFGTFGVSVYSGWGVESLHPLSPLTTTLNYGVVRPNGEVSVRLIYDHRVTDGVTIARALVALEQALLGPVLTELRSLRQLKRLAS